MQQTSDMELALSSKVTSTDMNMGGTRTSRSSGKSPLWSGPGPYTVQTHFDLYSYMLKAGWGKESRVEKVGEGGVVYRHERSLAS